MAGINRLIALGGMPNRSPYDSFSKGRQNAQNRQINDLNMDNTRQAMERRTQMMGETNADRIDANQKRDIKITASYMLPIKKAPSIAEAKRLYKQQAYLLKQEHGIDSPPEYQPELVDSMLNLAGVAPTTKSKFGNIDPSKYTQSSVAKFEQTGRYGDLVALPKSSGATQTVNIGGVDKATETYGKGVGEMATKRNQYAQSASKQKSQLESVSLAIAEGARTGKMEEAFLEAKSFANTLGIDTGDLSGGELIRTISNEMALRLRNPESGLGLTGNTSNRDLEFLKASVVGLARTEKGNIEIINLLNKYNALTIDTAAEQNRIIMQNGGVVPIDLDSQLMEYVDNYQFFSGDEKNKINKVLGRNEGEQYDGMSDEQIQRLNNLRNKYRQQ